ncbi:hypothetical protein H6A30_09210 [Bacteroides caecigallinarum]|uniref:Uncharacterized protein n=1 Tax=Candidatus Phocaeicola faecigallinarum TaxID=2838732 RepID=A0A948TE22_9BACT|nr:hypothetical protein [Bacteroides caecigallinarum]MBU3839015.1 hypothetical protein [Candidatus Phocaeicola faecigallinarum]
MHPYQRLSIQ